MGRRANGELNEAVAGRLHLGFLAVVVLPEGKHIPGGPEMNTSLLKPDDRHRYLRRTARKDHQQSQDISSKAASRLPREEVSAMSMSVASGNLAATVAHCAGSGKIQFGDRAWTSLSPTPGGPTTEEMPSPIAKQADRHRSSRTNRQQLHVRRGAAGVPAEPTPRASCSTPDCRQASFNAPIPDTRRPVPLSIS